MRASDINQSDRNPEPEAKLTGTGVETPTRITKCIDNRNRAGYLGHAAACAVNHQTELVPAFRCSYNLDMTSDARDHKHFVASILIWNIFHEPNAISRRNLSGFKVE